MGQEPLVQEVVSHPKILIGQGHGAHHNKVRALSGERGHMGADLAANSMVIQNIMDAKDMSGKRANCC